jgi:hypothetical protein
VLGTILAAVDTCRLGDPDRDGEANSDEDREASGRCIDGATEGLPQPTTVTMVAAKKAVKVSIRSFCIVFSPNVRKVGHRFAEPYHGRLNAS